MRHIFLLGDSIRMGHDGKPGYERFLRQKSAGRWAIHSPGENCQFAQYALRHVHQWAEHCPAPAIELVIFNCGLWDVLRMFGDDPLTPPEVYTLMMTRLNRRLRLLFPQAKLLFLTSTPTLEDLYTGPCLRKNADIRQYNALAQAVMERDGGAGAGPLHRGLVLPRELVGRSRPLHRRGRPGPGRDHLHRRRGRSGPQIRTAKARQESGTCSGG